MYDDIVEVKNFLYGRFLPAGKHYFFFIKGGKQFMLSKTFPTRLFKKSNIVMNYVDVQKREWPLVELPTQEEEEGGDENSEFDKNKTVFKAWREDTDEVLRRCFETDIGYSKLHRITKRDEDELERVQEVLWENYAKLKLIFLFYSANSTYPVISLNDFTLFCQKCKIIDAKNLKLNDLDRIFIITNVALHKHFSAQERNLSRYEFLEILVRLGQAKYKETGIVKTVSQALQMLLEENIFPNAEKVNWGGFRENLLYNYPMNEAFIRNDVNLKKVFVDG